ncbi:MAG TPA: hypothetical protein VMH81_33235 [Bryobacteraceae bacterium]|nr:hypothetical protein [Bryobacteraceae bacterium]
MTSTSATSCHTRRWLGHFEMLVHQILVKSEADVEYWLRALREALEPNGQLMVDLIPEV